MSGFRAFHPIAASRDTTSAAILLSLEQVEKRHILAVLKQTEWVIEGQRGAAKVLDLHPNTLRSRMKKLRIERSSVVPSHEISQPRSQNLA